VRCSHEIVSAGPVTHGRFLPMAYTNASGKPQAKAFVLAGYPVRHVWVLGLAKLLIEFVERVQRPHRQFGIFGVDQQ